MGRDISYTFFDDINKPDDINESDDSNFKHQWCDEKFHVNNGNNYFNDNKIYSVTELSTEVKKISEQLDFLLNTFYGHYVLDEEILKYMHKHQYDNTNTYLYDMCKNILENKLIHNENKYSKLSECLMVYTTLLNEMIHNGNNYIEINYS